MSDLNFSTNTIRAVKQYISFKRGIPMDNVKVQDRNGNKKIENDEVYYVDPRTGHNIACDLEIEAFRNMIQIETKDVLNKYKESCNIHNTIYCIPVIDVIRDRDDTILISEFDEVGNSDLKAICSVLPDITYVQNFIMSGRKNISAEGLVTIFETLNRSPHIKYFKFEKAKFTFEELKKIFSLVEKNKGLMVLDLSNNHLPAEVKTLVEATQNARKIAGLAALEIIL